MSHVVVVNSRLCLPVGTVLDPSWPEIAGILQITLPSVGVVEICGVIAERSREASTDMAMPYG